MDMMDHGVERLALFCVEWSGRLEISIVGSEITEMEDIELALKLKPNAPPAIEL